MKSASYYDRVAASVEDEAIDRMSRRKTAQGDDNSIAKTFRTAARAGAMYEKSGRMKSVVLVRERDNVAKGLIFTFEPDSMPGTMLTAAVIMPQVARDVAVAFIARNVASARSDVMLGVERPVGEDIVQRVRMPLALELEASDLFFELLQVSDGEKVLIQTRNGVFEKARGSNLYMPSARIIIPPAPPEPAPTPANDNPQKPRPIDGCGVYILHPEMALPGFGLDEERGDDGGDGSSVVGEVIEAVIEDAVDIIDEASCDPTHLVVAPAPSAPAPASQTPLPVVAQAALALDDGQYDKVQQSALELRAEAKPSFTGRLLTGVRWISVTLAWASATREKSPKR